MPADLNWRDLKSLIGFALDSSVRSRAGRLDTIWGRARLAWRLQAISKHVDCPHSQGEVLSCIRAIIGLDASVSGCIVEAGCYKGGSTAKFSLAAAAAGRELVAFDSFAGIPAHDEDHGINIFGKPVSFAEGEYRGSLEEVRENIDRFGTLPTCRFVPGWFEDTMVGFDQAIAVAYLDVDLAASTRTCLRYLYPRLRVGGTLFSQDGHLPRVLEVFDDDRFWRTEVGCARPQVLGLGTSKLLTVVKREPCVAATADAVPGEG
jgi:O-methyltransferase